MQAVTLSFRAAAELAEQTKFLAESAGLYTSDYIREAVREKNDRSMTDRITILSKKLSATHLAFNESIEDTLTDGII